MLQKENIWTRLKTESTWVTYRPDDANPVSPLFAGVAERQFRFVVGIWVSGNMQVTTGLSLHKLREDAVYESKWSPIPVPPAGRIQLPAGSYSITDPIITFEGGTRFYGKTDVAGMSLNVTVAFWDWDV